MIKNISTKLCTCDLCGSSTEIQASTSYPQSWKKLTIDGKEFDVCPVCFEKLNDAIEEMMEEHND